MENQDNFYYPIFCDLRGKLVVVIGGGMVAGRKVETLLDAGARVKIIAPEIIPHLYKMNTVEICKKDYEKGDLQGAFLVIAATDDEFTNREVSNDALSEQILCNVVDKPSECSFIVPSVVAKGPIKIAISTGGVSPALAKNLRVLIDGLIGDEYACLSKILGKVRPIVLSQGGSHEDNKKVFDILVNSQLLEAIKERNTSLIDKILYEALGIHIDLEGIIS